MNEAPKILIVEDSPTQALRLQLDLEAQQWSASSVGTADEALAQIEHTPPDVMIVDYCLPGMSGDELCRRIRMNINTRAIPIIMLTADEDEETEVRGLDSGADDFFKKSADTEILVIRIRSMLYRPRRKESVLLHNESAFRRAKVLAVDDSVTYLSHMKCLLQGEGYSVDAVTDPKEALRRLEASSFDLALVDLVMPELDRCDVQSPGQSDRGAHAHRPGGQGGPDASAGGGCGRLRRKVERSGRVEMSHPSVVAPQVFPGGKPADLGGTEEQGT
jgi:two-component system NtrC family sensor kinase